MKTTTLLLTILILTLTSRASQADDLNMCFESWEPFHFKADGKLTGIGISLMDKAMNSLGHSVSYKELPYARCIKGVKDGDFDAILLTSGEEPLVPTTVSAVFWEIGFVARPDWPEDNYSSLDNFDGKKAGLVSAYNYGDPITKASKNWDVKPSNDAISNLRKLSISRIDFTLVDVPWAQMVAKREKLKLKILSPTFQSYPQFTYFNESKSAYVGPLGAKMKEMIDNGTVNEVYQSFLGQSYADVLARNKTTFSGN